MSAKLDDFQKIYNCVDHPLLLIDNNGKIKDFNNSFLSFSEMDSSELTNKNIIQFINTESLSHEINFSKIFNSNEKNSIYLFLKKDKHVRVRINFEIYPFSKNGSNKYVASFQILDNDLNRWFKILTENMSDGVVIFDKELKIIFSNLRVKEFGLRTHQLKTAQSDFIEHLNAEGGGAFERLFTQKKSIRFEVNIYKEIFYEVFLFPVFNKDGGIDYILEQIRDISVQKNTEKALLNTGDKEIEKEKLKTEFLANISHETRTPMNGILGFSELLLEDPDLKEEHIHFVENIFLSGRHLMSLLDDIVELSRFEFGKAQINYSQFSLKEMITGIRKSLEYDLLEKKLDIEYNLSGIDIIVSDARRVNQLLVNILGNAVKFTEKGKISLNVIRKDSFYHFSITDTGIGISCELLDKIFLDFHKLETGLIRKHHGIGIGLSLCKRIVDLMRGGISVQSELSKGSTFTFTIPCITDDTSSKDSVFSDKKEPEPVIKPKTIFIADDDRATLFYYGSIFKKYSQYECILFQDGIELIKSLKAQSHCDLIILDFQMAGKSGLDCAIEIKEFLPDKPIIAATAHVDISEFDNSINSVFSQIIIKPISSKKLIQIIDAILN